MTDDMTMIDGGPVLKMQPGGELIPKEDFRTIIVDHPIVPSTGTLSGPGVQVPLPTTPLPLLAPKNIPVSRQQLLSLKTLMEEQERRLQTQKLQTEATISEMRQMIEVVRGALLL